MSNTKAILEKYTHDDFKAELNSVSKKFRDIEIKNKGITVSHFRSRKCVDCGKHLPTPGAKRCKTCNMKLVGTQHQENVRQVKKQ